MDRKLLLKLQGLHTIDTIMDELNLTRQSTLNLISRLKKKGYLTTQGGGKQIRFYKITPWKQRPRQKGMFDILNKFSPMKLNPWYDHQVHGVYGPEEALIDAIETRSSRVILASMRLFNHIKDWSKLFKLSKKYDSWQKVGALYDVARMHFRVRKMPNKFREYEIPKRQFLIRDYPTKDEKYKAISKKWKVSIPFKNGDIVKVKYDYT